MEQDWEDNMRRKIVLSVWISAWLVGSALAAGAADYKVETVGAVSASDVSAAMGEALQADGVRLLDAAGKALFEIWLRDPVVAKAGGYTPSDVLYGTLEKGAWLGVLHCPSGGTDFRGQTIQPGYYSLRYQHVLQDGNHMGVSVYRDFVLLVPVAADTDIDKLLSFPEVVALSARVSGTGHPAVLNLATPVEGKTAAQPGVGPDDAGHWVVRTGSRSQAEGGAEAEFPFAIILVGQAEF